MASWGHGGEERGGVIRGDLCDPSQCVLHAASQQVKVGEKVSGAARRSVLTCWG